MRLRQLVMSLACLVMVVGCASSGSQKSAPPAPLDVAGSISAAQAALAAGHPEQAVAVLETAANAFPTDKAPWLRIAQIHFDGKLYGAAIINALEAIERDPDDLLAHSIVAVSGLRVSSKALADLTEKNDLTGTVRTEAQELAKLLRTALGEEVLVPTPVRQNVRTRPVKAQAATPQPKSPSSSDPFESLLN